MTYTTSHRPHAPNDGTTQTVRVIYRATHRTSRTGYSAPRQTENRNPPDRTSARTIATTA